MNPPLDLMTANAQADAIEERMAHELDELVVKSILYQSGDIDPALPRPQPAPRGRHFLMREDPRLQKMPEKPTLIDFFRYRFGPAAHLLQSARLAVRDGLPEKTVLACLLHDIGVFGLIRSDHGYWGAQLIEPYVDEEVSWAVRAHQALRFYPDETVGYAYPEAYIRFFGAEYRPDPYIDRDYQAARKHRWYMTARLVTLYDFYAFDPGVTVDIEEFTDIIGRNFRQPAEGLGMDNSPTSHMWRTIIAPPASCDPPRRNLTVAKIGQKRDTVAMSNVVARARVVPKRRQGRPVSGENDVGRERLIAATEKLLRTLPPARVTISRIAREAKADPALVRYYFGNRAALLVAVVDHVTAHPQRGTQLDRPPVDALSDHIGKTVQLVRTAPFLHRLIMDELMQSGDEAAQSRVRAMNGDLVDFYRALLKADGGKDFVETDPLFLFLTVLGASDFFASAEPLIRDLLLPNTDMAKLTSDFQAFLAKLVLDGVRKR